MKKILIFLLLLAFTSGSGYARETRTEKIETLLQKKHKHLKHHRHFKHPRHPGHPRRPHLRLPPRPPLPPKP